MRQSDRSEVFVFDNGILLACAVQWYDLLEGAEILSSRRIESGNVFRDGSDMEIRR